MKVLITTDWYYPVINGVVTSVQTLAAELREETRCGFSLCREIISPTGKAESTTQARWEREEFIRKQG